MKDGQEVRRVSTAVIAGVCGLALVTGGGIAWWTANRSPTADTQSSAPTTAPALSPTPAESPVVIIPGAPSKSCSSATGSDAAGSDAAGSDASSSNVSGSGSKVAAAKAFAADGCPEQCKFTGLKMRVANLREFLRK